MYLPVLKLKKNWNCSYFLNYRIHKFLSLISQYSFWSLKLIEEFDNALCHLSCSFGAKWVGLWPFCHVVHHDTDVLKTTFCGFQWSNQVHAYKFKGMCNLEKKDTHTIKRTLCYRCYRTHRKHGQRYKGASFILWKRNAKIKIPGRAISEGRKKAKSKNRQKLKTGNRYIIISGKNCNIKDIVKIQ